MNEDAAINEPTITELDVWKQENQKLKHDLHDARLANRTLNGRLERADRIIDRLLVLTS